MITKTFALGFAKQCLPLYGELYKELKSEGGRVKFPGRFGTIRQNVANYVELYDDERKPGVALFLGLMGEQGFREFTAEASSWTQLENKNFLSELGSDEGKCELLAALALPDSEEEWSKQEKHLQSLPEVERAAAIKASSFFFAGVFSHFFNTLSLMTHGATLVSLVIGIDRYQSRIEDANYLTKRLADYRRFQKTAGSSRL